MKKNNGGFTLIEIMLVVVLISVSAVTVVLSLPESNQDLAKEEAQRFFHRAQLLNEDAILNGKDYGIRVDDSKESYTYMTLEGKGWQYLETKTFSETELPEGTKLSLVVGNDAWSGNEESLFEEGTLFDEEMFAELEEEERIRPPQLLVLSSGEMTPFQLSFMPQESVETDEEGWLVNVQESGVIELLKLSDVDEAGF